MAESGIVFRYVFDNTEYETYEEAKAEAESTVGGGHIYKRMKNISINQIKHWDYMQNPATYEDWEYAIGDDEDMGFVDYITPYLYFKVVGSRASEQYTYIEICIQNTTSTPTTWTRVNIGETFSLKKGEYLSVRVPEITYPETPSYDWYLLDATKLDSTSQISEFFFATYFNSGTTYTQRSVNVCDFRWWEYCPIGPTPQNNCWVQIDDTTFTKGVSIGETLEIGHHEQYVENGEE